MGLISNEQFLGELAAFYIKSREGGSRNVTVSMKPHDGKSKAQPRGTEFSTSSAQCLFRAKFGNKKISTAVHPKDVNKFVISYSALLRANMDNLEKQKKSDEKREAKKKAKTALVKS
ncbi:hypothetical protein WR25_24419 [Diploscapter pachys]|uniref:Signal recognition particle 14 kDa protein n=1 Tax=Diploscapter pachys TaxID=2018661 RepID=A0A2A2LJ71_9BILA|nr:hypothetical protein WR25_24419 [Diploscapter pachys]